MPRKACERTFIKRVGRLGLRGIDLVRSTRDAKRVARLSAERRGRFGGFRANVSDPPRRQARFRQNEPVPEALVSPQATGTGVLIKHP